MPFFLIRAISAPLCLKFQGTQMKLSKVVSFYGLRGEGGIPFLLPWMREKNDNP